MEIAGRQIGSGSAPYIIAELSGNHGGNIETALRVMEAAKAAGADAIKLQTYTPDTMTIDCDLEEFRVKGGLWDGYTLYRLYEWAHTPWEWHPRLFEKGRELDITVFSTPFDISAVELLEDLKVPAYKIASFEVTDLALIARVAQTKKPMIISTGMASQDEIKEALDVARAEGSGDVVLLHCISAYPAPIEESNVRTIPDLARKFGVEVGLSDHTLGVEVASAATALGASVIEKHVTLKRDDGGPDAAFSLEPGELEDLCRTCRTVWQALGTPGYDLKPSEQANVTFRRSVYVVRDVEAGEMFSRDNLRVIRPGYGLAPKHLTEVLGKRSKCAIVKGTALDWGLVDHGSDS